MKPNYYGGGQGPSTAEVFGRYNLYLVVGNSNRELKVRQFRKRIRVPKGGAWRKQNINNVFGLNARFPKGALIIESNIYCSEILFEC